MELNDLIKIVQPYTMASPERLRWKAEVAQQIIRENIPGIFVECGVWHGGSSAVQAHYAIPAGRNIHLFDSFEGMPVPSSKDVVSINGVTPESEIGKCVGSIEKVYEVMEKVGSSNGPGAFVFHAGWFNDTFPKVTGIHEIAMLNLDSDWFESELLCWETFYDKVVPGGFIYIDDFFYWPGCQKAAKQFFHNRDESVVFHQIGHSAWVQKGNMPFAGNGVWIQGDKTFVLETK